MILTSQVLLTIVSIPAFVPKPAKVLAFVLVGCCVHRMILTQTTGNFNTDYTLGSGAIFQYIAILDFALLTPLENLRNLHEKDQTGVAKRPFNQRVHFALRLLPNIRGIGWSHEPSHLPPRPSPSTPRSRFVVSRILHATCCFFIAYRASLLNISYAKETTVDKLLTGAPLDLRARGVLSYGLNIFCMIFATHAVVAASVVGCGFSSPERWPLLLGSPLQVWSIRRFWRRFWHQMIRRVGGESILSTCGLRADFAPARLVCAHLRFLHSRMCFSYKICPNDRLQACTAVHRVFYFRICSRWR